MRAGFAGFLIVVAGLSAAPMTAQQTPLARLPRHVLDVTPPSARVDGAPGAMTVRPQACRTASTPNIRQRIVDIAVQEWAYFGFPLVDYSDDEEDAAPAHGGRGRRRLPPEEAMRVAASIGGYWAVTPGGAWILERQNAMWAADEEGSARWRFPWSAAFISWVMCEAGLGAPESFQRAIAHHTYIDQAIRARDVAAPRAAYVASDIGQSIIGPGDMLCSSRRPIFRTLADRRRQLGQGARTHCDLIVKVDQAGGRLLAIGGNVRGVVGLKIIPAATTNGVLRPAVPGDVAATRPIFAHLRLRSAPAALNAFDASPTIAALSCVPLRPDGARLPPVIGVRCED